MPATKFSRRTLLTAGSALAVLPFLRALPVQAREPRQTVDIKDYPADDGIASFKQAFADGQTVVVPPGWVCENINAAITIPAGKTLRVQGAVRGNGRGRFILQDGCQVVGEQGGSLHNVTLDVRGSDCVIKGVAMSGFGPVAQIFIGGKEPQVMRNLIIDDITVTHANYAILRQGFHNQMDGARITHSRFSDLQGDAIEWNVAIHDRDILISDHVIERIDCTNGKINWGIGIGLAGSTYDNSYPEDQAVKNFVVANITGSDCRQLVHVENGKHFVIRNVKAKNITPDFSKKAGIDNATIAIYGCDNFVIDNIDMTNSAGMLIGYGVVKGKYLSIPQNFKLNAIRLDNRQVAYKLRGIQISSGNTPSFVAITNVRMTRATLELHNQPQHLFLRNINVMQTSAIGPALKMHFDLRKDVRGQFMARQDTLLSLANVHAIIIPGSRVIHAGENKLKSYNSATILQVEETMMNLKAVIPVAGLGMHMLPATKAIPKEMLPIVDKPMIQYIVDEIVAAGIKEIVLVTHASKNAVENHFDTSYELESLLEQRVKRQLLAEVQSICPPGVTIMNVRQAQPLGLGHSILCARPVVGDNPFIVVLPDIIIDDATADPLRYNLAAMVARFNETGRSQVLAKRMKGDLSEYSVIQTKEPLDNEGKVSRIVEFIEKPDQPQTLDSDLMAVGRYVLSADIWAELERTEPGAWGRIQLTDAIAELAKKQSVDAMLMTGDSYDCGKKMGYMQAFVKYGLRNLKEGAKFRKSIEQLLHE